MAHTDLETAPAADTGATFDLRSHLQELLDTSLERLTDRFPGLPADSIVMRNYEERMQARDQARIGLCMILRNAQSEILGMSSDPQGGHPHISPGLFERLAGEVWDMVVVDTGSDDATPHLASEAGARVYGTNWENDFAKARNYGLARLRPGTRFVLHLDGDEILGRESMARLNFRCRALEDDVALAVPLEIRNDDMPIEGSLTAQTRLFPAMWKDGEPQVYFTGKIHEQIRPSLDALHVKEELASDVRIVHTGYANPERTKLKCVRNREILEAELQRPDREREDYHYWWHLSKCEAAIGTHMKKAMSYVGDVAMSAACRDKDAWLAQAAFRWWGELLSRHGEPLLAIRVWHEGANIFPADALFPALIGLHMAQLGEREEAINVLQESLNRDFALSALDVPVQRIRAKVAGTLMQLLREKAYSSAGISGAQKKKLLVEADRYEGIAVAAQSTMTGMRAA